MRDFKDRRSTWGRDVQAAAVQPGPGKRTLTEMLPAARGGAPVQRNVEAAPARPQPTIHELFGGVQGNTAGAEPDAAIRASAQRGIATPASPLPHAERIQRSFGRHDISGVKAHTGSDAAASACAMGAQAYATGDHIVLGPRADLHTVAHEAAHVVQQKAGVQLAGGIGQVGDEYEKNADQVADAVVAGRSAEALLSGTMPTKQPAGQFGIIDRMGTSSAFQRRALESGTDDETEATAGGKQHAPCAECGSGDCVCPKSSGQPEHGNKEAKPHKNEAEPHTRGSIPKELLRYISQSGITSPSQMSRDQVLQIGQLARSRMPEHEIADVGRRSGVSLPAQGDAKQSGGTGQPVQRQVPPPDAMQAAGQAAAATAGTMWWLTLVDGPLPIGDILYGVLIAGAAVAAAATAASAVEQVCSQRLAKCLENPWQPEWNREQFGPRKDCGACYRECKHAIGIWPDYKCPL